MALALDQVIHVDQMIFRKSPILCDDDDHDDNSTYHFEWHIRKLRSL
eukprot:SAG11_NODE_629_length_8073_cov_6.782042_5_plen_47_part_00